MMNRLIRQAQNVGQPREVVDVKAVPKDAARGLTRRRAGILSPEA